jgi:hypothetical protein
MKPTKFEIICIECGGLSDHTKMLGRDALRCRCCGSSEQFNRSGSIVKTKVDKFEKMQNLLSTLTKDDMAKVMQQVLDSYK